MVAVAVIGILSAISISSYNTKRAKARQAEAKLMLSYIFNVEKSFYSEYSAYAPDGQALGLSKEGGTWYKSGWRGDLGVYAGSITGYTGGFGWTWLGNTATPAGFDATACANTETLLPDPNGAPTNVSNAQGFTAGSSGIIISGKQCDVWTIDHLRNLRNTQIGF